MEKRAPVMFMLRNINRNRFNVPLASVIALLAGNVFGAAADPLPGGSTVVSASDAEAPTLAALRLEQLMQIPVVTSASRFVQPITEAPSAAVFVTAQDIKDYGWRTLAQALASLPGLYVNNDRNYSYLGARGFLRPGDYDSRFLLMIDGYRTNDAVYDAASIGTESLIDIDLVERIEYIPGPGSAMYGSNAFFGVINVITKNGSSINGAQTAVGIGSYGEKKARATYGWHGQNGADVVLSATAYDRNGQSLFYPEFNTPTQNSGVARHLDYDRAQDLFAKFSYGGFTLSAAHSNRTKGVPTGAFGAVFNMPDSTDDAQSYVNAVFVHTLVQGVDWSTQAFWGRSDYTGIGIYANPNTTTNVDGSTGIWYGGDTHLTVSALTHQKVVVGVDFQRDARRDQYNYNLNPYTSLLSDQRSSNRMGAYLEDEIQLSTRLVLNAGLRYDVDTTTSGSLNPRVALIYKLTRSDTAKLIYGTAFRAPNAYELYYAVPGSGGQIANPGLKPEHISTIEAVFEHAFSGSDRMTLSVFRYAIKDLISLETDPVSNMSVYQNVDRARATGAELATENVFFERVSVRASYSWQLAQDASNNTTLQNSPRHLFKLNAVAPLFDNLGRLGTEVQCSASRLAIVQRVGGFCLTNFTLSSVRLVPKATISLSVYNAFDKRYAEPAGSEFTQAAIEQQSRTIYAKMVYGF